MREKNAARTSTPEEGKRDSDYQADLLLHKTFTHRMKVIIRTKLNIIRPSDLFLLFGTNLAPNKKVQHFVLQYNVKLILQKTTLHNSQIIYPIFPTTSLQRHTHPLLRFAELNHKPEQHIWSPWTHPILNIFNNFFCNLQNNQCLPCIQFFPNCTLD